MSLYEQFLCGAVELEQLVQDAQAKVRWAAIPIAPGEIPKAQILRAWRELRVLDYGVVRRTWYGICGPRVYPTIYTAWAALVERRAQQQDPRWLAERIAELERALERTRSNQVEDQPVAAHLGLGDCATDHEG